MSARELPAAPHDGKQLSPRYFTNDRVATTRKVRQCRGKQPSSAQKKRAELSRPAPGAAFPTNQRKSINYERN